MKNKFYMLLSIVILSCITLIACKKENDNHYEILSEAASKFETVQTGTIQQVTTISPEFGTTPLAQQDIYNNGTMEFIRKDDIIEYLYTDEQTIGDATTITKYGNTEEGYFIIVDDIKIPINNDDNELDNNPMLMQYFAMLEQEDEIESITLEKENGYRIYTVKMTQRNFDETNDNTNDSIKVKSYIKTYWLNKDGLFEKIQIDSLFEYNIEGATDNVSTQLELTLSSYEFN